MFCFRVYWCFTIFSMLSSYLLADVSPSHMFVILLWFSISLLGVMFHYFVWYFAIMLTFYYLIWVRVAMRCFVIHFCCFIIVVDVLSFIWCFAILIVSFIFLTKKHKPTKIYDPNYGCSDSLKGIRRHWGRARASTTFIFPTHAFPLQFRYKFLHTHYIRQQEWVP